MTSTVLDFPELHLTVDGSPLAGSPVIAKGFDDNGPFSEITWVKATYSVTANKSIACSGTITYPGGYGDVWSGSFKISSTASKNWPSGPKTVSMKILR